MKTKPHVLVVDDDPEIAALLSDYLSQHDCRVFIAASGQQMWAELAKTTIDLIVLDVMLPGDDGLTLCRQLREKHVLPILMLSAAGDETDRVVGLEMGADDYLAKPFSPRELLARVKALLRRTQSAGPARLSAHANMTRLPFLRFLSWQLDCNRRCLLDAGGLTVSLSTAEYELLLAFVENPRRVLTRDQLLDLTQGRQANPFDRAIDVQISRLRKKIEKDPKEPKIIKTIRGGGYEFNADVEREK